MRAAMHAVLFVLLFGCVLLATAQEGAGKSTKDDGNCGILYGKGHMFSVCAPKGWVLNNSMHEQTGLWAVFYPDGSSWDEAKGSGSVMYVNTTGKGKGQQNVAELMAFDAEATKKDAPRVEIAKRTAIKITEESATVQEFRHSGFDRFEAVAYIDTQKLIVMIAITSKDEISFKRDYPAFEELVRSYKFFSSNVTVHQ
jgi:hypothetical protein